MKIEIKGGSFECRVKRRVVVYDDDTGVILVSHAFERILRNGDEAEIRYTIRAGSEAIAAVDPNA